MSNLLKIFDIVKKHDEYRGKTINLIPSENVMSEKARYAMSSDFGHRYINPVRFYRGTKYSELIIEETKKLATKLYDAKYAFVEPQSGTLAVLAAIFAFTDVGDKVMITSPENGGFPIDIQKLKRKPVYFPFDESKWNIDISKTEHVIKTEKPKLIFLGASTILFPHPVKEVSEFAESVGSKVIFDGSHVLGLIAGKQFQDPLREGAEILLGSTHKTLAGPQGGIIVGTNEEDIEKFDFVFGYPLFLVDNPHLNRIAALGITLEEYLKYGEEYAKQVVRNSKWLGKTLVEQGIPIGFESIGFTESHQLLWQVKSSEEGIKIADTLELANIIVDEEIRVGTQEVTRRGMKEKEMEEIANLVRAVITTKEPINKIKEDVVSMVERFSKVRYA